MRLDTNNKKSHQVTRSPGHQQKIRAVSWCLGVLVTCIFWVILTGTAAAPKPSKVLIRKLRNGHYQLLVNKKPYLVKGVCYNPVPIGKNHEYDWWSDPNEPWMVDGKLMQEMGINTVRVYKVSERPEAVKKVIRDLYENFGIRTILGDWLGFWEYPCPFYGDKGFQEKVKAQVLEMVRLYKDEPGILLWILGNENNYSFSGRVNPWSSEEIDKEADPRQQRYMRAQIYYSFVNDLAKEIKRIDSDHPVALGNGELGGLEVANEFSPDIDLVACIIYRGKTFGNIFNSLRNTFDRPVILAEFGADSYDAYLTKEDQNMQAFFLKAQWRQVYENSWRNKKGTGNCLGGTFFEWTDEWWKHNEHDSAGWWAHDTGSNWSNGSYYFDIKAEGNKNMNEEWFGIVALSEELVDGINKRTPRKAYYVIREFWMDPTLSDKKRR